MYAIQCLTLIREILLERQVRPELGQASPSLACQSAGIWSILERQLQLHVIDHRL